MTFRTGLCCFVNPFPPRTAKTAARRSSGWGPGQETFCPDFKPPVPPCDNSPGARGSPHVLQWPCAQGRGEERFDLSMTRQGRRQCRCRAFHLPSPSALPWETGNLDACPQAKATRALKIRGFLLADPEGIAALEACPWELPPAPWPCREGSRDGSRLLRVPRMGLEGQPFPRPGAGMQRVSWQDCVSPLQSSMKCSHPSKALRG